MKGGVLTDLGASDDVPHHAPAGLLPVDLLVWSLLDADDPGSLGYGELGLPVESATWTSLELLLELLLALAGFVQTKLVLQDGVRLLLLDCPALS